MATQTTQERITTALNQLDQIAQELDWIDAPPEAYTGIAKFKWQLIAMRTLQGQTHFTEDQLSQLAFIEYDLATETA